MANPIPVFPDVGPTSTTVFPGRMSPRLSASRIMLLGDPVLDRAGRVLALELAHHLGAAAIVVGGGGDDNSVQLDQRGVPDEFQDAGGDLGHRRRGRTRDRGRSRRRSSGAHHDEDLARRAAAAAARWCGARGGNNNHGNVGAGDGGACE
jgi:hypothetical protein